MGVTILFGDGSQDRERALLKQMQKVLQTDTQAEVFFIVPNKIKFKTEVNVLERLAALDQRQGTTLVTPRVQVFSLSRLVWYYMNDTSLYQRANLSPEAVTMLVQSLLQQHQDELQLYGNLLGKQGFISQMAAQIQEIKASGLTWDDVNQISAELDQEVVLQQKLHDVALIGSALDAELGRRDQFVSQDLLQVLKIFLEQGQRDLTHQYFYIDGYSQMTRPERGVVEALMLMSAGVTIALPGTADAVGKIRVSLDENDLFFASRQLAQQLFNYAQNQSLEVQVQAIDEPRNLSEGLQHLSQFWIDYEQVGVQIQAPNSAVEIWSARSRYQEIEQLAQSIRMAVNTGAHRYQDFVLMTPDLQQYANILPAIFQKYNIPLYLDMDQLMVNHPLFVFVRELLDVAPKYRLADILALLKTELLVPEGVTLTEYREALALTENYALAKNYTGKRWTDQQAWQFDQQVTDATDEYTRARNHEFDTQLAIIHNQISQVVAPFLTRLQAAGNARLLVKHLYDFLVQQGVQQRLLEQREVAVTDGRLSVAQQIDQVWGRLMDLVDDVVMVFDQGSLSLEEFKATLIAAMEQAKFAGIPAAMDQVLVTETGMVQVVGVPQVIIFGATSQNLPVTVSQHALLQDRDRNKLQKFLPSGTQLRETTEQTMAQDSLQIYQAMMISQQKVIWSYPTSDGEVKLKPSTYIERLARGFQLKTQQAEVLAPQLAEQLGTWASTLSRLVLAKAQAHQLEQSLAPLWQTLDQIMQQEQTEAYTKIMGSLNYNNQSKVVDQRLINKLFGSDLKTSISRLESYARNPYEFFLQFGLKLKPRPEMQLTEGQKGTYMHALLEHVFHHLGSQALRDVSSAKLEDLEKVAIQTIFAQNDPTFETLHSNARWSHLTKNLEQRVDAALKQMQRGQRHTLGHPKTGGTEVAFGRGNFQPLRVKMPEGSVILRGKIDRYDQELNNVAIVDYKSGSRAFDYTKAYYGQELQLLTYWQALNQDLPSPQKVSAATFFELRQGMLEPEVKTGHETLPEQIQQIEDKVAANNRYRGIILDKQDYLQTIENGPYALDQKKDGTYKASSDVVTEAELETLRQYNLNKVQELAGAILAGKFPIQPFRQGNKTGLQYSDYLDVMHFDAMLGDHYQELKTLNKKAALEAMQQQINSAQQGGNDGVYDTTDRSD